MSSPIWPGLAIAPTSERSAMAQTAADILVEVLLDWRVDTVFGMPGDGINGIMESLRKRQDAIRFVQVRHEESAAFMACGYAKFTGRLGVCLATAGPGGLHLLNGLYDAKLDGQTVLAIKGMPYHDLIGTRSQQDVELDKVFADVAEYSIRIMGPTHVENVAHLACRTALLRRGVSHITFPVDLQEREIKGERSKRNVPGHMSDVLAHSARLPHEGDLAQAADILNQGQKVVILAGRGAVPAACGGVPHEGGPGPGAGILDQGEEGGVLGGRGGLAAGAEPGQVPGLPGAPRGKALPRKAVGPDGRPFTAGTAGLLGTLP